MQRKENGKKKDGTREDGSTIREWKKEREDPQKRGWKERGWITISQLEFMSSTIPKILKLWNSVINNWRVLELLGFLKSQISIVIKKRR